MKSVSDQTPQLASAMKLVVVFVAFIAFCAGSPFGVVPGDNSHYVEGESRYIWIPDGDGVPQLVDLLERPEDYVSQFARNGANNQYWLYTRQNPTTQQVIVHGDANTIWSSNYSPDRPLKVIVHGWRSDGNSDINPMITAAFLEVMDCNVIVVDWKRAAQSIYWTSVGRVPDVGFHLGLFLDWLISTAGGNWNNVHLVGFSLGAHVVGNAGRTVGGRVARITGLDPAGPNFGGNNNALNANDAGYVECIHTDGGLLGIFDPIGQTNFYPNGGRNAQPGCWISTCSHSRAYELFASSIYTNHFVGQECADLNEARRQRCSGNVFLNMGNSDFGKHGNGLFGLTTERRWPY